MVKGYLSISIAWWHNNCTIVILRIMERKTLKSSSDRLNEIRERQVARSVSKKEGLAGIKGYKRLLTQDEEIDESQVPDYVPPVKPPAIADPVVRETIIRLIRDGNYPLTAAIASGISFDQFKTYLEKGRIGKDKLYYEFWKDVCEAEAHAEIERLASLSQHADSDWKVQLEIMSRRWPERWGNKTQKVEISGSVEHNVRNEFAARILEDPTKRELARKLLGSYGDPIDAEYTEIEDE